MATEAQVWFVTAAPGEILQQTSTSGRSIAVCLLGWQALALEKLVSGFGSSFREVSRAATLIVTDTWKTQEQQLINDAIHFHCAFTYFCLFVSRLPHCRPQGQQ